VSMSFLRSASRSLKRAYADCARRRREAPAPRPHRVRAAGALARSAAPARRVDAEAARRPLALAAAAGTHPGRVLAACRKLPVRHDQRLRARWGGTRLIRRLSRGRRRDTRPCRGSRLLAGFGLSALSFGPWRERVERG